MLSLNELIQAFFFSKQMRLWSSNDVYLAFPRVFVGAGARGISHERHRGVAVEGNDSPGGVPAALAESNVLERPPYQSPICMKWTI